MRLNGVAGFKVAVQHSSFNQSLVSHPQYKFTAAVVCDFS